MNELALLFERDLDRLINELKVYSNEAVLWKKQGTVNNTAGNLALHLIGNIKHFITHILGGTEYTRDREAEFSSTNIPKIKMIADIEALKPLVINTLSALTKEDLNAEYPLQVFGRPMSTREFMYHLYGHLNYHLGQISYHRRLLDT